MPIDGRAGDAKPGRLKKRAEFLRAASKGKKAAMPGLVLQCLPRGDAAAVRMLLAERRTLLADRLRLSESYDRLAAAADDCLGLMEAAELEGSEGEDGRIEALRQALTD